MAGHEVNVALLNDDCGRVHAEEGHWCQMQPLLALYVVNFAAFGTVILACFTAEGENVLPVDQGERRVESRRVHLLLRCDAQIGVNLNAFTLGHVLVVLVEHDSTENVDV